MDDPSVGRFTGHATRAGWSASRMTLARHTPTGEPPHLDWFIERPGGDPENEDERRLITFRLRDWPAAAAWAGGVSFEGERIGDHRARYLDWSGELSGGRGRVERLWGVACEVLIGSSRIEIAAEIVGGVWLSGRPGAGSASEAPWVFHGVRAES